MKTTITVCDRCGLTIPDDHPAETFTQGALIVCIAALSPGDWCGQCRLDAVMLPPVPVEPPVLEPPPVVPEPPPVVGAPVLGG